MTTVVVVYLVGVLLGLAIFLLIAEEIPRWREANRRVDEALEYLRSLPSEDEGQE